MGMHKAELKLLKGTLSSLKDAVTCGTATKDVYYKALIGASFEAMISVDLPLMVEFLSEIPPSYFKEEMVAEMERDRFFESQVMDIAEALTKTHTVFIGFTDKEKKQIGSA